MKSINEIVVSRSLRSRDFLLITADCGKAGRVAAFQC